MKKFILIITAITLIGMTKTSAQIQLPQGFQYENSIQVTGSSEREIVPDEIFIRIIISEDDTKGKTSIEKMESNMISKLQQIGIDTDSNLKIGDMSSKFRSQLFGKSSARTTATYQLKVDGALTLSKVYQALESIGISNLSITKLSHSKLKEYQDELRQEAIINAKKNAQMLAEAIGQNAGKAIYIADYNSTFVNAENNYLSDAVMLRKSAGATESYETDLSFRNIKLNYSLTAKFVLE